MNLTLDIVSDNPALNTHSLSKVVSIVKGQTATVILRLWQADKNIRYIPDGAAVMTVDLKKSDGSVLTKTLQAVFPEDLSIQKFDLSALETADVIGQNLIVKIVEGANINFAILQKGLQKVALSDGSC